MSRPPLDLGLYLVTDTALCGDRGVVETVRQALPGGVTAVQVREPHATTRELCALSRALLEVLAGTGVPLLVNDRLDVALAVGAQGVHLGQSDLPVQDAHRVAPELLLGLSVSTPVQVDQAPEWLDYLGVGPVQATATKPEAAAPLGLAGTAALARRSRVPCVAIGGVGPANARAVRATGVAGIAVVSAVCAAADPRTAAADLVGDRP